MTWLLTIEARDPDDTPVTLRYADGAYDAPDDTLYLPRIKQPGFYQSGLYAGQVVSVSRSGVGETVLINADGGLDHLADYAVDGRAVVLFRATGSEVVEVMRGTAAGLSFNGREVTLRLREPQARLQRPHPHATYAGTNMLPDGLEGTADDIQGQPKPRVYGDVRNAQPVLVNSAQLIYQVSARADCAVTAAYDKGAALTAGTPYASLTELQGTAPAAGEYRAYQGYVRLGASPVGTVTVDARTADAGAGDVMAMLCAEAGQACDVTVLDTVGEVGLYVTQTDTTAALLDRLAESVGGYWRIAADGVLRAQLLTAPDGGGVVLEDYQISSIDSSATGAGEGGLPIWRVTVRGDRIEQTQTDLVGNVDEARRARLASQYREATAERPAVRERHPLAGELVIDTALRSLADAQALAERLADLVSVRRDRVTLEARLTHLQSLTIGDAITVRTPRLGYSDGRVLRVIGRQLNARAGKQTLELWG